MFPVLGIQTITDPHRCGIGKFFPAPFAIKLVVPAGYGYMFPVGRIKTVSDTGTVRTGKTFPAEFTVKFLRCAEESGMEHDHGQQRHEQFIRHFSFSP